MTGQSTGAGDPAAQANGAMPTAATTEEQGSPAAEKRPVHWDPHEGARRATDELARRVADDVWGSLPYSPRQLRSLVDSLDQLRARFAAARVRAASGVMAAVPPLGNARDTETSERSAAETSAASAVQATR